MIDLPVSYLQKVFALLHQDHEWPTKKLIESIANSLQ
jgi:hypothetical protein